MFRWRVAISSISEAGCRGCSDRSETLLRPASGRCSPMSRVSTGKAPLDKRLLADEHLSLGWATTWRGRSYGEAFSRDDHLLPMAGAIWSATPAEMLSYPAAAFIRFHDNHGLLQLRDRPPWETVVGGSRSYVERLTSSFAGRIRLVYAVHSVSA